MSETRCPNCGKSHPDKENAYCPECSSKFSRWGMNDFISAKTGELKTKPMQEIEFELEMAGYRAGYKINHPDQVLSIKPDLPGESGIELRWTFIGNTWSFYRGPHLLYMVEVSENSVQVEYKLSSKRGQRIARLKERADDFTPFDLVVREFIAERDKT